MTEYIQPSEDDYLAVKRGIGWLDEKMPDWRLFIDTKRLNLASCKVCVLGQIFGSFYRVEETYNTGWSVAHGFTISNIDHDPFAWEKLQQAWLEVLVDG